MYNSSLIGKELEDIVCNIIGCDYADIGGLASESTLSSDPLIATYLCLGRLYDGTHNEDIGRFIDTWSTVFKYPDENQEYTEEQYVKDLKKLIELLQK